MIVDCNDFTDCSFTCGGGISQCQRSCQNGNFGDVGCATDEEFNIVTCNDQDCRKIE